MNFSLLSYRPAKLYTILWHILFYTIICYGFHRYLFKYSHGAFAKDGYQQTPLIWQAGKFVVISVILSLIYLNSRFISRIPVKLLLFYAFMAFVLFINIGSILLYGVIQTDEIEYLIYATLLLPLGFVVKDDLQILADAIGPILNVCQFILIASNAIVIFNYFMFRIIPFHAYEGVLLRFGGLWDDPNTLAIVSVLLMGYALINKQYLFVALHVISIILTVSLNGYILLIAFSFYWMFANSKRRLLYISLFVGLFITLALLVFYNLDYVVGIYNAKQESIDQHSSLSTLTFYGIPFLQPVIFHETWFISESINYFPLSIIFTLALVAIFVRFFLIDSRSIQRLLFILFFLTSLFLPFLYMFPVNFIALLFLVLYTKGVRF
jgi:hypothetical protein